MARPFEAKPTCPTTRVPLPLSVHLFPLQHSRGARPFMSATFARQLLFLSFQFRRVGANFCAAIGCRFWCFVLELDKPSGEKLLSFVLANRDRVRVTRTTHTHLFTAHLVTSHMQTRKCMLAYAYMYVQVLICSS